VLDPATDEHRDVGCRRRREDLGDLAQRLQRLGCLHQHDPRARRELRPQRQGAIGTGEPGTLGVARQRPLTDEQVLRDPYVPRAVQRHRTEGQRSVRVVDDGDLARSAGRDQLRGLVEQQPVGRIDGDQLRRLDVRVTAQQSEDLSCLCGHKGHQTPGRPTGQETPVECTGQ
jgi:hypothetical protein